MFTYIQRLGYDSLFYNLDCISQTSCKSIHSTWKLKYLIMLVTCNASLSFHVRLQANLLAKPLVFTGQKVFSTDLFMINDSIALGMSQNSYIFFVILIAHFTDMSDKHVLHICWFSSNFRVKIESTWLKASLLDNSLQTRHYRQWARYNLYLF